MSDFVGTPPRSVLRVRLRRLPLKTPRNYVQLDVAPGPGVNVFIGANGHGKTNLLGAVAMLALSSSPRARRELELVGPAGSGSRIQAEIDDGPARREIPISLDVERQRAPRTIEVDPRPRRAIHLPGHITVVRFWPDGLG